MSNSELENAIEAAWNVREEITPSTTGETRKAIEATLSALDTGSLRVAEKNDKGDWIVNQWAKKAVLLGFRLKDMEVHEGGPQNSRVAGNPVRRAQSQSRTRSRHLGCGIRSPGSENWYHCQTPRSPVRGD